MMKDPGKIGIFQENNYRRDDSVSYVVNNDFCYFHDFLNSIPSRNKEYDKRYLLRTDLTAIMLSYLRVFPNYVIYRTNQLGVWAKTTMSYDGCLIMTHFKLFSIEDV